MRIVLHVAFWLLFTLMFVYQNPEANGADYIGWGIIISVIAAVVYTHLYVLFPRYFFKKDYVKYGFLLTVLVSTGAGLMNFLLAQYSNAADNRFLQSFINLLLFVIITSSVRFFRENIINRKRLTEAENANLKTEIALLKSQVNPHFLFNALNNLYGLILENRNRQAADVTLKLSDLMRYLLESSKNERVSLQREINFMQDYLALEKIRLSQNTDIKLEVSGLKTDILVAPLLFIPLIENTFKHGLHSLSPSGFAHFTIALQESEIYFEAKNSVGKNIIERRKSGVGLKNLRKRLELIYPNKHALEIENAGDIFMVTLYIKL